MWLYFSLGVDLPRATFAAVTLLFKVGANLVVALIALIALGLDSPTVSNNQTNTTQCSEIAVRAPRKLCKVSEI